MNILSCLVCVLGLAVGAVHAGPVKSQAPSKPASSFQMRTTSFLDDGTQLVQTRYLSVYEAEATGVLGGTVAQSAMSGAPPTPDPPRRGSLAPEMTRVVYHQELIGWTRDTSFARVPGGLWELVIDDLIRNRPPRCDSNDNDCGRRVAN